MKWVLRFFILGCKFICGQNYTAKDQMIIQVDIQTSIIRDSIWTTTIMPTVFPKFLQERQSKQVSQAAPPNR